VGNQKLGESGPNKAKAFPKKDILPGRQKRVKQSLGKPKTLRELAFRTLQKCFKISILKVIPNYIPQGLICLKKAYDINNCLSSSNKS